MEQELHEAGSIVDYALGAAGATAVLTLAGLMRLARRRCLAARAARARREALARRLIAACTFTNDIPLDRRLLDCARQSLRRAQLVLAQRGQVDVAASVLDERVRLEHLLRLMDAARGEFDAASLFGEHLVDAAPSLPLHAAAHGGECKPGLSLPRRSEDLAAEIVRQAMSVEVAARRHPGDLPECLGDLRATAEGLAATLQSR